MSGMPVPHREPLEITAAERIEGTNASLSGQSLLELAHGLPSVLDSDWPQVLPLADELSTMFLADHGMVPLRVSDVGTLVVAVANPDDAAALAALRAATGRELELRVASAHDIAACLARLSRPVDGEHVAPEGAEFSAADLEHLDDLALEAPAIELVNRLLAQAVFERATDLHLEQSRGRVLVRQRVDGMLRDAGTLAQNVGRAAISRVKILAHLNIAERRLPQDGQARVRVGDRDYDLRVVTIPTVHGECAAVRILATAAEVPRIGALGLSERDQKALGRALAAPNGLIIVTGPTGSGKTTTLAACLSDLNDPRRKIVTIEDPVEYQIDGLSQIQVKPEIGVTFTSALRAILRYDPDIIMVGEIRDSETAQIAVHAALTGHLVLTTLHTNSAVGAITRLLDMDVPAYLLSSALRCVVGQRLVRTLCSRCRQRGQTRLSLPEQALEGTGHASGDPFDGWTAVGCDRCGGTGYSGRLAIFEILVNDAAVQSLVRPDAEAADILAAARASGMTTMVADGLAKCAAGLTTVDEVVRVVLNS
jgi:general secretion pathway protein E